MLAMRRLLFKMHETILANLLVQIHTEIRKKMDIYSTYQQLYTGI